MCGCIVVSPGVSTEYSVTISTGGCSNMATVTVTVEDCSIVFDCPDLSANIGDACDDGNSETENDIVTDNCECLGTVLFDCPELGLNNGEPCENDGTVVDCQCLFPDCNGDLGGTAVDTDGDGVCDVVDNCPMVANEEQADSDSDGLGDFCDCDPEDNTIGLPVDWYADNDGDNFGDPNSILTACDQPIGYVSNSTDCDDNNMDITEVGASCDDNDATTTNDVVGADCICAGESLTPVNDLPCDALRIECADSVSGSTEFATSDEEPTEICGTTPAAPGVWYSFIGTGAETTVSLCGSDFDTRLNIYSGTCDGLICETGNDDNSAACGPGFNSQLTFDAELNTEYFVFVNGFNGAFGDFELAITCIEYDCQETLANIGDGSDDGNPTTYADVIDDECGCAGTLYECVDLLANIGDSCDDEDPTTINDVVGANCECTGTLKVAPENDEACTATLLECGAILSGQSFIGATQSFDDACLGSGTADVWFTFVTDGSESVTIAETETDVVVDFWTGDDCDDLIPVSGCSDFSESATVSAAGTYYFRIRPYYSSNTTYGVSLTCTPIVYDCPDQESNFGDLCNDGDPNTSNDIIGSDCICAGTPSISNDECVDATPISCGDEVTGTTIGANADNTPFCGTSSGSGGGVWFSYTAESDQIVTASLCTSSFDTKIRVYSGSCGDLICVAGNDDDCGTQSEVTFQSFSNEGSETNLILVHGFSDNEGEFTLNLSCEAPPLCTAPSTLITSITDTCENGDGTFDVSVTLSQDGTLGNYVITNDFDEATETISINGTALFTGFPSGSTVMFTASNEEDIDECNVSGSVGFTCPPPAPENDECSGAIALECGDNLSGQTLVGATQSIDDGCSGTGTADVWYTFTTDGISDYIIAETSSTDVVVSLYLGDDCETLVEVGACNDTPEFFSVSDLGTYYFRVRPYFSSGTSIAVSLTCQAPLENDDCADATPIACGEIIQGSTVNANNSSPGTCGTTATAPGVWYEFTGTGGIITTSLCGSDFDTKISVFSGGCGALICEGGNDDFCGTQSQYTFESIIGYTYYIYVHGFSSDNGDYTLEVSCESPCFIGTPCDDGNPNTENDALDEECNCLGTPISNALVTSTIDNWNNSCGPRDIVVKMMSHDQNGNQVIDTAVEMLNADGSFSLTNPCPSGTYDILIKVEGALAVLMQDVELVSGVNSLPSHSVILGDVNDDNSINVVDLSVLISDFGSHSGEIDFEYAKDLNCDGVINVVDLSIILVKFGMIGAQFEMETPETELE